MRKPWLVFMLGVLVLAPCSLLAQPVAKVAVSASGAIELSGETPQDASGRPDSRFTIGGPEATTLRMYSGVTPRPRLCQP